MDRVQNEQPGRKSDRHTSPLNRRQTPVPPPPNVTLDDHGQISSTHAGDRRTMMRTTPVIAARMPRAVADAASRERPTTCENCHAAGGRLHWINGRYVHHGGCPRKQHPS